MPYAPAGESSSDIWLERSYFVGGFLAAVAYGASFSFLLPFSTWYHSTDEHHICRSSPFVIGFHCCIFGICVYFLLHHPSRGNRPPNYKLIAYVTVIWLIATVNVAARMKWNEMIWIDDRDYPGGPIGFLYNQFTLPINTVGNTTFVVNSCLTDLMVVSPSYLYLEPKIQSSLGWIWFLINLFAKLHRAWVIWSYNYYVIAIPFLAIITSAGTSFILKINPAYTHLVSIRILVLSILTLVQSALPGANLWTHLTFSFALPYWSLSIAVNMLLTLLIII